MANGLSVARYYNSDISHTTAFGMSWSSSLTAGKKLYIGNDQIVFVDKTSEIANWDLVDVKWVGGAAGRYTLSVLDSGEYQVVSKDGSRDVFDSNGLLLTTIDRGGSKLTYSYSPEDSYMLSVTNSYGKSIVINYSKNKKIERILLPDGNSVAYTYNGNLLSQVIYEKSGSNTSKTYHYNQRGYLVGITDENGDRFASWDYNVQGQAILSEHFGGADRFELDYSNRFNSSDPRVLVTNALGKKTTFHLGNVSGVDRVLWVEGHESESCLAANKSYSYDVNGYLDEVTSWDGTITDYDYDSHGLVVKKVVGEGTTSEKTYLTTWDVDNRLKLFETLIGMWEKNYYYNELTHRLEKYEVIDLTQEEPVSRVWKKSYVYWDTGSDLNIKSISVDGPRLDVSDVSLYEYDSDGFLNKKVNALGHVVEILEHDAVGRPLLISDSNQVLSRITYTPEGWMSSISVAGALGLHLTKYEYDNVGQLTQLTLPDGAKYFYEYDGAHRLVKISDGENNKIVFELDFAGNVTGETTLDYNDSVSKRLSRSFDELNRLSSLAGFANQKTNFEYGINGNIETIADPLENVTRYEYDALGQLLKVVDPFLNETNYTHDLNGNLVAVRDAEGFQTQYEYNAFGEILKQISPDTGTTNHTYDRGGNLASMTDAEGRLSEFTYDPLNRLTSVSYPNSPSLNIIYEYDGVTNGSHGVGRLTGILDASGSTRYTYDHLGNVLTKTTTIADQTFITTYLYDQFGRLESQIYPSGRLVHFGFDGLGRISSVATEKDSNAPAQLIISGVNYLPFGPATQWTYGNGIVHNKRYNLDYRVSAVEGGANGPLYSLMYTYDANNNVETLEDLVNGIAAQVFSYDAVNRIDTAVGNYGTIDFDYDKVGNRTQKLQSKNGSTTTEAYSYSASSHQLEAVNGGQLGNRSFSYDASGNVLTDSYSGPVVWEYDEANRPKSVTINGERIEYHYNALGQRVLKLKGNVSMYSHYDELGKLLAVSDEQGRFIEEYIWFNDILVASLITPSTETEVHTSQARGFSFEASVLSDLGADR